MNNIAKNHKNSSENTFKNHQNRSRISEKKAMNVEEWYTNVMERRFLRNIRDWGEVLEEIEGGLAHVYSIPQFDDKEDLFSFFEAFSNFQNREQSKQIQKLIDDDENLDNKFIKKIQEPQKTVSLKNPESREAIVRDLLLAFKMAQDYIANQPRPSFKKLITTERNDLKDLLKLHREYQKRAQNHITDRIFYCILLKKVITFFRIIHSGHFNVDYENQTIDLKNDDFIDNIARIFDDTDGIFIYKDTYSEKFGRISDRMNGIMNIDGYYFPISGSLSVKSVDRLVSKMSRDPKYSTINAVKDIHRMRIEVENGTQAMLVGKYLCSKLEQMSVNVK